MKQKTPKVRKKCSVCGEDQFSTPSGMTCKNGHGGADSAEPTLKKKKKKKRVLENTSRKVKSMFDPKPGGEYNPRNAKLFLEKINKEIMPMLVVEEDFNPSYKYLEPKTRMFRVDVPDNRYLWATLYTSPEFKKLAEKLSMEVFGAEITHSSTGNIFWFVSDN